MWNRCGVWGMCCCGESKFASPNHIFFVIKHFLFGKTKALHSRYKTLIMTLLWTSIDTWTSEDTNGLAMLILILVIFALRNESPLLRTIWDVFKVVMMIILVICTAGFALKWIKGLFK